MTAPERAAASGLAWSCWLPMASLIGVEIYASGFDGWGAWATAPLFLAPLGLSLVIAGGGVVRMIQELRVGPLRSATVVATLIAALPLAWLLVRRYVV